jgi:hypothetical protein
MGRCSQELGVVQVSFTREEIEAYESNVTKPNQAWTPVCLLTIP